MAHSGNTWWKGAEEELARAQKLNATGDAVGAYFHAGQAVEFALKAIYLRNHQKVTWPPENRGARWHDLTFCAHQAGLSGELRTLKGNKAAYASWLAVRDWRSDKRYPGSSISQLQARDMLQAVANPTNGVFQWLRRIYHRN